ncbi:MAG: ABC transporter ATP-binding protein [Planctomycetota bacterium]|nr:ABC transporter ATP-binding protein [Planctomycetota bacterium]
MSAALEVRAVTKTYGKLKAVDDVSFSVAPGQIVGFIGPNGAGKTTTMRICATLVYPDKGDVFIRGKSVLEDPRAVRRMLGFMPDSYGTYANTTIWEYLDFYARAYDLRGDARRRRVGEVMEFTSLSDLQEKEIAGLSKGMKQRLCLAKTLLHDPPVMILDEPAAGLDPRARVELRELVRELSGLDKAILLSSHILTELAEMCDSVIVIERGQLKADGTVADLTKKLRPALQVYVRTLQGAAATERALVELPGIERVRLEREGVVFEQIGGPEELAATLTSLVQSGLSPVEFTPQQLNLEEVFLSLTEGKLQ